MLCFWFCSLFLLHLFDGKRGWSFLFYSRQRIQIKSKLRIRVSINLIWVLTSALRKVKMFFLLFRVSANRSELTTLVLFGSNQDEDPLFAAEIPSLLFLQKNLLHELLLRFPSRIPGPWVSWAGARLSHKMDLFITGFEERAVPAGSPWAAGRGAFWPGAETRRQTLPGANPGPQSLLSRIHYTHRINSE